MVTWQLLNGKAMYDCCHKKRRIIVPKGKEMGEISQHENTHSMRENPKGNKEIWESRETSSIIQKRKKNIGILKEQPLEREMKVKTVRCLRHYKLEKD